MLTLIHVTADSEGMFGDYATSGLSESDNVEPLQIVFNVSSLNGTVQCVQIGIEDDTVIEDDEQFEISLVLPDSDDDDGGGSLLAVTIVDNDGKFPAIKLYFLTDYGAYTD